MVGEVETTLQNVIPSYLYVQYNDDDALQAFVNSYNTMSQEYLTYFNDLNLPNYTKNPIEGDLLDWVAGGVYGFLRPVFPTINLSIIGPFNTWAFNTIAFNDSTNGNNTSYTFYTSDDAFRRVICWHFYKDDGDIFTVRWLKRRIYRFLFGVDGLYINPDQTYRISVTFGPSSVNIRTVNNIRTITGGAIFGRALGARRAFGSLTSTNESLPEIPQAYVLNAALQGGILEVPFQYNFNADIGGLAKIGPYVYKP